MQAVKPWQRRLRILMLVNSMGKGGAERVAATLCNGWAAYGHRVVICATYFESHDVAYDLRADVEVVFLRDLPGAAAGSVLPRPVRKLRALRASIRQQRPDVVVSFLTNVNIYAILATRGLGIPLVVSERADPASASELSLTLRLARALLYRSASAVVAQTASAAERLRTLLWSVRRVAVIPNPVPPELSTSDLRVVHSRKAGVVVAMGRLAPEKRFDVLIRAFHRAFSADDAWQLKIWGDGPLREELQSLVSTLGLDGRVQLPGITDQPWRALEDAQIFALTSAHEGFPNAMLEAMALGVPCVAVDCPSGPAELSRREGTAILVPPDDLEALATALADLAADEGRRARLGRQASEFVRSRFSLSTVLADWDSLFQEVAAADGPS